MVMVRSMAGMIAGKLPAYAEFLRTPEGREIFGDLKADAASVLEKGILIPLDSLPDGGALLGRRGALHGARSRGG